MSKFVHFIMNVKEKIDYHGSWIDQASYFGYD